MNTFLMKKLARIERSMASKRQQMEQTDTLIEHHYEAIRSLRRKQSKENEVLIGGRNAIVSIYKRLSKKEKELFFNANKI